MILLLENGKPQSPETILLSWDQTTESLTWVSLRLRPGGWTASPETLLLSPEDGEPHPSLSSPETRKMEFLTGNSPPETRGWRASPEYLLLRPEDKNPHRNLFSWNQNTESLTWISSPETREWTACPLSARLRPQPPAQDGKHVLSVIVLAALELFLPVLQLSIYHMSAKEGFITGGHHQVSGCTNFSIAKFCIATSVADPDVYPGSRIRVFSHPGSRIPDLGSRIPKNMGR